MLDVKTKPKKVMRAFRIEEALDEELREKAGQAHLSQTLVVEWALFRYLARFPKNVKADFARRVAGKAPTSVGWYHQFEVAV